MNRTTPRMRDIAEHLIHYEMQKDKSLEKDNPAAFHFIDKLRPHLAKLTGDGGFRALVSRALVLANGEVYWLRAVHVNGVGTLEGLEEFHGQINAAKYHEGRVAVAAHMLELLVAFIGPALTARLIGDIWPKSALKGLDFGNGGKDAKKK